MASIAKQDAFNEINQTQDYYINELITLINNKSYSYMKQINFTSPTGTGKTKMMSMLINNFSDYYFIITSLSKGQLHLQIRENLIKDCKQNNFIVYGTCDYKLNSKLQAEDIINKIPSNTKCIWLRDEGHIATNRYDELLAEKCYKIVNFSATNIHNDIQCNFTHTMMLRTVNQMTGTPSDAINKLLEIKKIHKDVKNYNPCAIFRCVSGNSHNDDLRNEIIKLCKKNKLKYIDLNEDNDFLMAELCKDDNEYDVIINKFKIVEGIDIRRAHILYMDNQPKNNATIIQIIGRCRRNALLYRDDIDILAPENEKLLEQTRQCFVFYNVENMELSTDDSGELQLAFCNKISCEELKAGSHIFVKNGQLPNGLFVIELAGQTGEFDIVKDQDTGFNIVNPLTDFYREEINDNFIYLGNYDKKNKNGVRSFIKINIKNLPQFPINNNHYNVSLYKQNNFQVPSELLEKCLNILSKYNTEYIMSKIYNNCLDTIIMGIPFCNYPTEYIQDFCKRVSEGISHEYDDSGNYYAYKNGYDVFCYYFDAFFPDISLASLSTDELTKLELKLKNENYHVFRHYDDYTTIPKIELIIPYDRIPSDKEIEQSIKEYSIELDTFLNNLVNTDILYYSSDKLFSIITQDICNLIADSSITIYYSYSKLFEDVNDNEFQLLKKDYLNSSFYVFRNKSFKNHNQIDDGAVLPQINNFDIDFLCRNVFIPLNNCFLPSYTKIYNDKESAIIGVDIMESFKDANNIITWYEQKAITSKINKYNKFNSFITKKYYKEIKTASNMSFNGKNNFELDTKCNSIIGYCVEYYSKYLLYGENYLKPYLQIAKSGISNKKEKNKKAIIIRACMLKYCASMSLTFGYNIQKLIKTISTKELIEEKYDYFIDLISLLGERTAIFIKQTLYQDTTPKNNIDPNLSIKHISGLADYITEDTILDVKVLGHITEKEIRQVLGYHYLSTKRSDLNIKRVIVYDATTDKSVTINISDENISNYQKSL